MAVNYVACRLHTTVALISTIHTSQIALLYYLKLPVCKPTNGDALHKALNGRTVMANKTIYKHN